jgi:hypothetical protein
VLVQKDGAGFSARIASLKGRFADEEDENCSTE